MIIREHFHDHGEEFGRDWSGKIPLVKQLTVESLLERTIRSGAANVSEILGVWAAISG